MRSYEVFSVDSIPIASGPHALLLDLLAACRGPLDGEILRLRLNADTQQDIASALGIAQQTVSKALTSIYRRAEMKDEDNAVRLGMRLRVSPLWRHLGAEANQSSPVGLRGPRHAPAGNHARCWCSRKKVAV